MQEGVFGFQAVAFSPRSNVLATGGVDRKVALWDVLDILKKHPPEKTKFRPGTPWPTGLKCATLSEPIAG